MKVEADSIEGFFIACGERQADMRALDAFIQATTNEKPVLHNGMGSITMLGYKVGTYKPRNGDETTWPLIAIAPQKNHLSLYICALSDGQYIAEKYQNELGKVNCGKSCIRFNKFENLDLDGLKKLLEETNTIKQPFGSTATR